MQPKQGGLVNVYGGYTQVSGDCQKKSIKMKNPSSEAITSAMLYICFWIFIIWLAKTEFLLASIFAIVFGAFPLLFILYYWISEIVKKKASNLKILILKISSLSHDATAANRRFKNLLVFGKLNVQFHEESSILAEKTQPAGIAIS